MRSVDWLADRVGNLERRTQTLEQDLGKRTTHGQNGGRQPVRDKVRAYERMISSPAVLAGNRGRARLSTSPESRPSSSRGSLHSVTCDEALHRVEERLSSVEQSLVEAAYSQRYERLLAEAMAKMEAHIQELREELLERICLLEVRQHARDQCIHGVPCTPGSNSHHASANVPSVEDFDASSVPNVLLHVVVRHSCDVFQRTSGEVTVEARALEKVSEVKQRAHDQLNVWYRFCALGGLDEDDSHSMPMPSLTRCRLRSGSRELEDHRCLAACGLEDGAQLQLVAFDQDSAIRRSDASSCASRASSSVELQQEDEQINLVVSHPVGEVHVEARMSDSIHELTERAYAQLDVWRRFCADDDAEGPGLPPLEECGLHAAGRGDGLDGGPRQLDEGLSLRDSGLTDGMQVLLRRLSRTLAHKRASDSIAHRGQVVTYDD